MSATRYPLHSKHPRTNETRTTTKQTHAMKRICILGGTGFVGQHLTTTLATMGYEITILTRHRERHKDLLVLPAVKLVEADMYNTDALISAFKGKDVVINLIGVLHDTSRSNNGFQHTHVNLARNILKACQQTGVRRILHMSALHAHSGKGSSRYLRSKGEAETIIHNTAHIDVTSFRPSVIFGAGDSFLNRFAALIKMTPALMPFFLACASAKFAPVYVNDVTACMVASISNKKTFGKRYNLCGPTEYSLEQLVTLTARLLGKKTRIVPLGNTLSTVMASILGMLPGKLLTLDNVDSMKLDSTCKDEFPAVFGIRPTPLEEVAPSYINSAKKVERFDQIRTTAGR